MKLNVYGLFILLIFFICLAKGKEQQVNEQFIDNNFDLISKKENILTSIIKLINLGQLDILKYYLKKLASNKINFKEELDEAINRKMTKLHSVFNKLKYKDEYGIQKVAPAFEWAENKYSVHLNIKYSNMLNSLACPEVDDEQLTIKKDKRTIHYEARCLMSDYQMKFDLKLTLFSKVTKIERQNKERGQTKFSLEKETKDDWGRLLKPGERLPENSSKMY